MDAKLEGEDAARTIRGMLGMGDEPAVELDDRFEAEAGLRIFYLDRLPSGPQHDCFKHTGGELKLEGPMAAAIGLVDAGAPVQCVQVMNVAAPRARVGPWG
jgi:hypothetical protein